MQKNLILVVALSAILGAPATQMATAEPATCEGFLWPLTTEFALMKATDSEAVKSGATLPALPKDKAITLSLVPASQVVFAATPTSTPKPEDASAFGGVVNFEKVEAGHYQVTLSSHGWIDVIQNGKPLEATGHTGAKNCDVIRKSVRFEIGSAPLSIQVNGVRKESIKIAVRPAAD